MDGFQVDPDALTAASKVVVRQDRHIQRVDDYISGACSNFGAFSGVLNLFQGSYESAVATAHQGLADSRAVADKLEAAFVDSRKDYLDTDRDVYDWFRARFGDLVAFAPYDAPGSGESSPEGPHQRPGEQARPGKEDAEPGLPKPHKAVETLGQQVLPGSPNTTPPWVDVKGALKNEAMDLLDRQRDEYAYYRWMGYDERQALELARGDARPSPQMVADGITYDQAQSRAGSAYNQAYTDAINSGSTDREARDAGNQAASTQYTEDRIDRDRRQGIADGAGNIYNLYDQVDKAIKGTDKLIDHVGEAQDIRKDQDEYDQYEQRDEDRRAEEWAGR